SSPKHSSWRMVRPCSERFSTSGIRRRQATGTTSTTTLVTTTITATAADRVKEVPPTEARTATSRPTPRSGSPESTWTATRNGCVAVSATPASKHRRRLMPVSKVLHVIPAVGPQRGGPSAMARQLAGCLARAGIETHVATTNDSGAGTQPVQCGAPIEQDGVTYWYFPRQARFYTFSWPLGA